MSVTTLRGRRVALYARHSTLAQYRSVPAQLERCREVADKEGATVVAEYADRAKSGAVLATRAEAQAMLIDAETGLFEAVLMEDLSRASRDQADVATMHKILVFHGVPLFSVTEGEINELHIALKGAMNALYLTDLSDKTRRGQRAAVAAGRAPGGRAYGYEVVRRLRRDGTVTKGERRINPAEAKIVRRIFREAAAGKAFRAIAADLNQDGIPSPRGVAWSHCTLRGSLKKGSGLLRNPVYTGQPVYGRVHCARHPITGQRVSRPQPESEWLVNEQPRLQIIDQELFEAVQERLAAPRNRGGRPGRRDGARAAAPHPRYLTSGRTWCASCGARLINSHAGYLSCSTWRKSGSCSQRWNFRRDQVVAATLAHLATPAVAHQIRQSVPAFARRLERRHAAALGKLDDITTVLGKLTEQLTTIHDTSPAGVTSIRTSPTIASQRHSDASRPLIDCEQAAANLISEITTTRQTYTDRPAGVSHEALATAASDRVALLARKIAQAQGGPADEDLLAGVLDSIRVVWAGPGRKRLRVRVSINPAAAYSMAVAALADGD